MSDEEKLFNLIHNNKFRTNKKVIIDKMNIYSDYITYTVTLYDYMFQIIRYISGSKYKYTMLLSHQEINLDSIIEMLKIETIYKYRENRINELYR